MTSLPKTTTVQTLLFTRPIWNLKTATSWARKHGFRASDVEVADNYIRLRQENPAMYQPGSFRTIPLASKQAVQAVIGRPWIKPGNPHPKCELFETIHRDWKLHRRKHAIYAGLAKAKGTGKYNTESARRRFKPLVASAAKLFRREHKIKPPVSVIFPASSTKVCTDKLMHEFLTYWNKGQLDQYLPRAGWSKRKEK
jgi:hypothetical protein